MSQGIYTIQYGETTIAYELRYAPRRSLAISVAPDLQVSVIAPPDADLAVIAAKVRSRAAWIVRQQRELAQYLPRTPPRQYRSGETHRYLGRQYRLKVVEGAPESVRLTRGWLHMQVANKEHTERVKALLGGWYQTQAQRVFPERLAAMLPRFQPLGISAPPALTIKPLRARWGSCSGAGTITLNLWLIQVPKHQIDYVIVHELCHLIEHNHSKRFYLLLDRVMPDWRERRAQLNLNECP
jgi:predicted metal-dependent hydrolase